MEEEQREPKLPSNLKEALDSLGMTRAKELEAFGARLFEYEMALITLLMAELDEAEGFRERSRFISCRSPAGALAEAQAHARYQEALTDYLTGRALLKTALKQLLGSGGAGSGSEETRMITHNRINAYFRTFVALPGASVFSERGFSVLAGWSERQQWWPDFVKTYSLCPGWRSSSMGDSHLFALSLFAFLNDGEEMEKSCGGFQDDNGAAS